MRNAWAASVGHDQLITGRVGDQARTGAEEAFAGQTVVVRAEIRLVAVGSDQQPGGRRGDQEAVTGRDRASA